MADPDSWLYGGIWGSLAIVFLDGHTPMGNRASSVVGTVVAYADG